ncbi:murein transglycosylase [Vibrio zhanjiangensis]|uniref:Murein transglycosylase n=1 Tax=Vibrio zhanjiangensis TaxID=1046128 RepID=A0ABQ6EY34_9VIBR|nr:murein transglycosylase [Vibrio zhanjiangensis]GLT18115.1 murein transglycosylase [Vibrio zhanjiangensis]
MTLTFPKSLHGIFPLLPLRVMLACCAAITAHAWANDLQQQRAVYDKAQRLLDKGSVSEYVNIRDQIKDYPLTPYTDYRAFLINIAQRTPAEVENFIEKYKTLPFSGRIRAPYIDGLAQRGLWKKLSDFQTVEPRGESYQCHYYYALYRTGNREVAFKGAEKLWQSGESISDACDSLFSAWDQSGSRTDQHILERMQLAFEARNGSLMNYLSRQLRTSKAKVQAEEIKVLFTHPERVLEFALEHSENDWYRSVTAMALKKLARKDIKKAFSAFEQVVSAQNMSIEQSQALADYLSFRLMNTDSLLQQRWRDKKIASSTNNKLIERRIRLAIQDADWQGVINWITLLPESNQSSLRWQYWLGRSELAKGKTKQGSERLEQIVGQRNFYSVAAAKEIKRSINYPVSTISFHQEAVQPFRTALIRIEELIEREKITAAKNEWEWLLDRADDEQKEMLAAYAANKQWSHLSVQASIQAKMWDNIELRFPVAHRWWFDFYGEKHSIDPITLMSVARQESALDVLARSPVGARGIMQVMPSTAKYTARKYQLMYRSSNELYEVGKNIEIGSHYLKGLLERYDNNRVFAFAAYNAGPNRVKTWRERTQGRLDAYAFIEAIPIKETRGYVQNILMFETYYRDLLGVDGAFLNQHEIETRY